MRARSVLMVMPLVILAACSSGSGSPSPSSSGPAVESTVGASVAPATTVAAPVSADLLPTASGVLGEKPTLTFPAGDPPPSLQRVLLTTGTGPLTQNGDWLITNYLGQVWGRTVFDNSYDRGSTTAFQIGLGKVVPGWDVAMAGIPVGSRVLLSLPPVDGYGSQGKASAGITGSDTLVFVVDVIQAVTPNTGGQTDAVPQPAPSGGPQVTGALGIAPTVFVPTGLAAPTVPAVNVLATGTGAPVKDGKVLAQYVAVTWTGKPAGSTWPSSTSSTGKPNTGPQQLSVGAGTPFAGLAGIPLGSRVLVQLPETTNSKTGKTTPAAAAVVDLLAQTS